MFDKIDELSVNTIRTLSIESVQKANSGHPGLPMGAAPMAYVLWNNHLKVNPKTSRNWIDRDRFVLSAGHGSALLYSLLHLSGYNVSLEDLKSFRQWDSKTPGHPEVHHTDGVEATTGPLGQGIAMAVGMAMTEAHMASVYNREGYSIIDHYTYALCGDGDLMEGISQEASSLAGHLKLGKLILLYDSNNISLDGPISKAFTENVGERFKANGWQYILVKDGNDLEEIDAAIREAKEDSSKPTIIEVKTTIGYGAPKAGTSAVHGAPLGEEGVKVAKETYSWKYSDFIVPEEVSQRFKEKIQDRGRVKEREWHTMFAKYKIDHPKLADKLAAALSRQLPTNIQDLLPKYDLGESKASRVSSKETIQELSKHLPYLWGGSADLASSNNTMVVNEKDFQANSYDGRNIWFGVREFAMAAIMNGIELHRGTRVYAGTFFVFSDYLRPSIRLAAIQQLPVIYVLTHDSIAVGEDGPTHEPVEQLASLRAVPGIHVIRPADGNETVAAWLIALQSKKRPTVLVLSRQNLPVIEGTKDNAINNVSKGAYVISSAKKARPDGIILASGSEVFLAIKVQQELAKNNEDVSVISFPSFDLFEKQSQDYKDSVLPAQVAKRIAIEAGSSFGWDRYIGNQGSTVTIDRFGASAPGPKVLEEFGFTVENVLKVYNNL